LESQGSRVVGDLREKDNGTIVRKVIAAALAVDARLKADEYHNKQTSGFTPYWSSGPNEGRKLCENAQLITKDPFTFGNARIAGRDPVSPALWMVATDCGNYSRFLDDGVHARWHIGHWLVRPLI